MLAVCLQHWSVVWLPNHHDGHVAAGTVAVVSAGTADQGVAEECKAVADFLGCYSFRLPDVSVDGLHRILHNLPGASAVPLQYSLL